jgi:hypothetical protein
MCAFESKKVVDSRYPILLTRCEKRSKKNFQFPDFTFQLPADLIEILDAGYWMLVAEKQAGPMPN